MQHPPLSLYIHIPWCAQKCPYCDFNSHAVKQGIPEQEYVQALTLDLQTDAHLAASRPLQSIFFGGGTPSIFSAASIAAILKQVKNNFSLTDDCEITLEANPGTLDNQKLSAFAEAGINRFSIGVQSFQAAKLNKLGRIHNPQQAIAAAQTAAKLTIKSFNLDLMHGLPEQNMQDALADLQQAIDLQAPHISWYQLTIEPNTLFASQPPKLPQDEVLADIQQAGQALLAANGYHQYEVSAYSKKGYQSQHNLNYWRFGDYLAVGCGAHGKITQPEQERILRYEKIKHPKGYLAADNFVYKSHSVAIEDRAFEYFMNRFRLLEACPVDEFTRLTGLPFTQVESQIDTALSRDLLTLRLKNNSQYLQVTERGQRYLNDLLALFI
ncbi:radical SAM family heme chaperone HemW [Gayadomonas joobiniege]|uniref:radical SAM family heme chaperone HemW n=1 Tax=Gayadomonas joobiniege TaxID=1234606 RepID=UPI00036F40E1|nr:radical SAM family heme chaperone HemW [Gayadomonas joobiniege]